MDKTLWFCDVLIIATLFPICYLSHLDMNEVVLGKHVRRTSFTRPKPSSLWEWTNVTNHIHYVIFIFFFRLRLFFLAATPYHVIPRNFRLLFYSVYSWFFLLYWINLMKTDIGWPVEILYTSAFFTLFDSIFMFFDWSRSCLIRSNVELHWSFRVFQGHPTRI